MHLRVRESVGRGDGSARNSRKAGASSVGTEGMAYGAEVGEDLLALGGITGFLGTHLKNKL